MTPHIEAKKGEIAKTVIMPGDPLRAKFIAEMYLTDYKLVNQVRGMLAYTGKYEGIEVTIMASGMGMPSMGIYSYELYKVYDVDTIIRVGTCGSYTDALNIFDVVLVDGCYSESSYAMVQSGCEDKILYSSRETSNKIINCAKAERIKLNVGNIHSTDVFYKENNNYDEIYHKYGCFAVEMESFSLFHNANILNKKAACILTVSDSFITKQETTIEERQKSFTKMIELALKSID